MADNTYASFNMGQHHDLETASQQSTKLKESGKHTDRNDIFLNPFTVKNSQNSTTKTSDSDDVKGAPLLPKIFIALFIVLFVSVITLSYMLYQLDQKVTSLNSEHLVGCPSNRRESDIEVVPNKMNELGRNDIQKDLKKLINIVHTNKKTIKANSELITRLQEEEKRSAKEIEDVNHYADQLKMRIQYDHAMEIKIKIDFNKIMELAGIKDKVSGTDPTLQKLLNQKSSFDETYEKKWGIKYGDILRLTSVDDFKEKELPVLAKIGRTFNLFTNVYNRKWQIEFKDVIKFTERSDLTNMTFADKKYIFNTAPNVFLKIDYLFNTFTQTYQPKWQISFKDVISVSKKLVEVGAIDIPVLKRIDGWFVDNFNEIWGSSFEGLFHELIKSRETERENIVGKLKKIAEKNALEFLPATFGTNYETTISGFVKIHIGEAWGTIFKNGYNMENTVRAVCHHGGYSTGVYLKNYAQKGSFDRTNMTQLLRSARCYGDEPNITLCTHVDLVKPKQTTWPHTDDVAVKCTL